VLAQTFRHEHRVAYAECTLGNHVYYARYLELLEEARGEFFRSLSEPLLKWQQADTIFPVVECRLRYKRPARYDDILTLDLWISDLERIRLNFSYRILNANGAEILLASTLHACSSLEDKLKRIPPELTEKLKSYVQEQNHAGTAA